jgi:hypothetical protein
MSTVKASLHRIGMCAFKAGNTAGHGTRAEGSPELAVTKYYTVASMLGPSVPITVATAVPAEPEVKRTTNVTSPSPSAVLHARR